MLNKVTIASLGLIGGSLAAALRQRQLASTVTAWGPREGSLKQGMIQGLIDSYSLNLAEAVAEADLVVVCSPTQSAEPILIDVLKTVAATTIVSDVASVKGNLVAALQAEFGEVPANVVLAHPIAGSERSGVTAADPNLFVGHKVILSPNSHTNHTAVATLSRLYAALGAVVEQMTVSDHDRILAGTSHLPHILAFNMVGALSKLPGQYDVYKYAAGGLRDFTRIAASDPQMWAEIALANKSAILEVLACYQQELAALMADIEADDGSQLQTRFAEAKAARDHFTRILAASGQ